MKLTYHKYPLDILICILWSSILLPLALFNINNTLRIIFGLPFILFIPGYLLIFALFPTKKTDRGIDLIERTALSFGLSIAIVPLIGLALNYTPWGIRLEPILLALFSNIIIIGIIGWYQWTKTNPKERFILTLNITLPKNTSKLDNALTIILIITILIAVTALIYVIITPKTGEKFTELYLLGPNHIADNYPRNLTIGQNTSLIIGIVNHEYQTINYSLEIWLINQTTQVNITTNTTTINYHEMWYLGALNVTLPHQPITIDKPWTPQWEYNYTFSINENGQFKLAFLLYTKPSTDIYNKTTNYAELAEEKIDQAYRENHLWITVI